MVPHSAANELRQHAETRMRKQRTNSNEKAARIESTLQRRRLLHELQVHQVELEMQNTALQESRDRTEGLLEEYTDLYDFSPAGYFTLTADGVIQRVNHTGARFLNRDRSHVVGAPLRQWFTPAARAAFSSFLQRVFAGSAQQTGEFVLRGSTPRTLSIEATRSATLPNCRAVVVDISDRKRVEQQIRVSEVRYRRLFEAAHDGVLLLDPVSRRITDANPFMTRLLGYTRAQLVGKELYEIGLLKDEAESQKMFRRLKRRRDVRYEHLPLKNSNGAHQDVEVVANLYQESGQPVIQCNIRDITERKRMEEARHRDDSLLSALVAQAPFGVYVVNEQFRLQKINPLARRAFRGIHPLLGRDLSEVIHTIWPRRVANQVEARFRHTLKTGASYQSPEFVARRRDTGLKESYEWQIQRITLPVGEYGVACFFNDTTERRRIEAAKRRMEALTTSNRKLVLEIVRRRAVEKDLISSKQHQRRLLKGSSQMQEQLRDLSHQILQSQEGERKRISRELHDELSQLLVGINVNLENLANDVLMNPRQLKQKLARTQRLVRKSVEMVHTFARELRPTTLDDLGLVPALHAFVKEFARRTGIQVQFEVAADLVPLDSALRTVLYRVAQSALSNVERHSGATRVSMIISQADGTLSLKIHDDGKSFKVVQGVRAQGSKRLGLLGMRERIEMVGGRFRIASAPGKGTTVEAAIPLAQAPPAAKKSRRSKPARRSAA